MGPAPRAAAVSPRAPDSQTPRRRRPHPHRLRLPRFPRSPRQPLLEPILQHHDRDAFDVFCYSDAAAPDATTARLRAYPGTTWRNTNVAVFGDSHGGDVARKFVNRLGDIGLPVGTVTYTAYIDAIETGLNDLWRPANAQRLRAYYGDCDCTWHDNFYQFDDVILRGNTVPHADYNERIFNVSHNSIDDDASVKSQIIVNFRVII